jgi:hypothetical protein
MNARRLSLDMDENDNRAAQMHHRESQATQQSLPPREMKHRATKRARR